MAHGPGPYSPGRRVQAVGEVINHIASIGKMVCNKRPGLVKADFAPGSMESLPQTCRVSCRLPRELTRDQQRNEGVGEYRDH